MGSTCQVCGYVPSNPKRLYLSILTGQWRCDNGFNCRQRARRAAEKKA